MVKKPKHEAINACELKFHCKANKGKTNITRCCCFCEHRAKCEGPCLNDPEICGQFYVHQPWSHDPLDRMK